jgi:hypothetical protein
MTEIKEELTTEHEIYISIGFKNPIDSESVKAVIDTFLSEEVANISSWGTHTKAEYIGIIDKCDKKNASLITTIESLQENFNRQIEGHKYTAGRYSDEMKETKRLNSLIESQKEEIEKLREIQRVLVLSKDQASIPLRP